MMMVTIMVLVMQRILNNEDRCLSFESSLPLAFVQLLAKPVHAEKCVPLSPFYSTSDSLKAPSLSLRSGFFPSFPLPRIPARC
jgi:hypothetical protein